MQEGLIVDGAIIGTEITGPSEVPPPPYIFFYFSNLSLIEGYLFFILSTFRENYVVFYRRVVSFGLALAIYKYYWD